MNQACPNCSFENAELLPRAFYTELANLPDKSPRSGIDALRLALDLGPPFPKQQGEKGILLQKIAPPQRVSYYPILAGWYVATLGATVVPSTAGTLVAFLALLVAVFALTRAYRFNMKRWPLLLEKWGRSYICRKCGEIFEG